MSGVTSRSRISVVTFVLLVVLHVSNVQSACSECTSPPSGLQDCTAESVTKPPRDGGQPCYCVSTFIAAGCYLKPCENVSGENEPCDCSKGTGSNSNPARCFKFPCTGKKGECETCKKSPPSCTGLDGGSSCSCAGPFSPTGCTLQPCTEETSAFPCICKDGVNGLQCYNSTCPGNLNGGGGGGSGASGSGAVIIDPIFLVITATVGVPILEMMKNLNM